MKKKFRKLALNTETLRYLDADLLKDANGASGAVTECTAPGSVCTAACSLCSGCLTTCPICTC